MNPKSTAVEKTPSEQTVSEQTPATIPQAPGIDANLINAILQLPLLKRSIRTILALKFKDLESFMIQKLNLSSYR